MRKTFFAVSLVTGLATSLAAGDTMHLKLEPERGYLFSGSPQEVVVKIDLTAASHKKKSRRTPLNLAIVLDRSGSMTGAKIEKARQVANKAQGDAPGIWPQRIPSPERAKQDCILRTQNRHPADVGEGSAALSGLTLRQRLFPGRCPGLYYCRLSG